MRYVLALAIVIAASGCAKPEPFEQSRALYIGCLNAKPVEQCQGEKARLDADLAIANARSQRMASQPPLVLSGWTPPAPTSVQQPVTCRTYGNTMMCN